MVLNRYLKGLPLYVTVENKTVALRVEENYNELQRKLNEEFKITATWKLEYLDDYAENQPINDDISYFDCLKNSDGQAYYMNVIEIVNNVPKEEKITKQIILCIKCQSNLEQTATKCQVCGYIQPYRHNN